MLYEHMKHDGSLPIVGVNTFTAPDPGPSGRAHRAGPVHRGGEAAAAGPAAGLPDPPRRRPGGGPRRPPPDRSRRRQRLRRADGHGAPRHPGRDHRHALRRGRGLPPERLSRRRDAGCEPRRRGPRRSLADSSARAVAMDGPYQVRSRPDTRAVGDAGERLGAVGGAERVGLVGQQHQVGVPVHQVGQRPPWDTGRSCAGRRRVSPRRDRRSPLNVRDAHHHPGVPPDRDHHPGRRELGRAVPLGRGRGQPPGRARPRARRPASRSQRSESLVDRLGHRDPHRDPGRTQPLDVDPAVLLLVGHHQVRAQAADGRWSGFFVPRTRTTSRPAGWVHQSVAPTSRSGTVAARASVREGTSDTTRVRRSVQVDRVATVVLECRHVPPRLPAYPPPSRPIASRRWPEPPLRSTPSKRPGPSGRPGGSPTSVTPWPPPPRSCGPNRWCWPRWTGRCDRSG